MNWQGNMKVQRRNVEALKQENKKLRERTSQLPIETANFELTEKDDKSSTGSRDILALVLGCPPIEVGNTQASIQSTSTFATYYDECSACTHTQLL